MASLPLKLRLVTFDVTNTVIRVIGSPGEQYARAARDHGIQVSDEELVRVYRPTWKIMKTEYPNFGSANGFTSKQWWAEFIGRVLTNAGHPVSSPNTLQAISQQLWVDFSSGRPWEVVTGARATLEMLSKARTGSGTPLELGVISNFDERLHSTLLDHDLRRYFRFLVTSASSKADKPDPKTFQAALNIGQVSPEEVVHIGDYPRHDYWGARHVGITSFVLDTDQKLDKGDAHFEGVDGRFVLRSMTEVPQRLAAISDLQLPS